MKTKKLLLPLFLLPLIVSCGGRESSTGNNQPSETSNSQDAPISDSVTSTEDNSSEDEISSSEDVVVDTDFLSHEDDWVSSGVSIGGVLIDVSVGEILVTGESYPATISYDASDSETSILSFYDVEGIIRFEGDFINGFTLTCLKAGGTNLTVKDNDGNMLFRYAINVRNALSVPQITDFITDKVNYFEGGFYYDKYQIAFIDSRNGMFYANESGSVYPTMKFTYSFHSEEPMHNQEYVYYQLDILMSDDSAQIKLNEIQLSVVGTSLHAYQKSGLVCLADAVLA